MTFDIDKFMALIASANSAPEFTTIIFVCSAAGFMLLVTGILFVGHFLESRYGSISESKIALRTYVRYGAMIVACSVVVWTIPWMGIRYKDDYLAEAVAMISLNPNKSEIMQDKEIASTYTKLVEYFNRKIEDKESKYVSTLGKSSN